MAFMTFESILKSLPDDQSGAIGVLIDEYQRLQRRSEYYWLDDESLLHIKTTLGKVARELAARLLDAYPAQEGVTVDDIEMWMQLERIAE